ncbi:TPA: hypothetical protein DDW35_02655 [Candidatus Sumerlaeota bacterium]|nr:hypothetical protein [Candidatus Sumerlaeota bacterium]
MKPSRLCWIVALWAMLCAGAVAQDEMYPRKFEQIENTTRTVPLASKLGDKGLLKNFEFTTQNAQRNARIYIPTNYDASRPVGILFGFHGSKEEVVDKPSLDALWNFEYHAESQYFICVALTFPFQFDIQGWQGVWDQSPTGMRNGDVKAVQDLLLKLKENYCIDEDRVFAIGASSGGGFAHALTYNLPGVFAAVAGECPVEYPISGQYIQPLETNRYSIISFGGMKDQWHTAQYGALQSKERQGKGMEGDFYTLETGHCAFIPDNANVPPPLPHVKIIQDFFAAHPRNYQQNGYTPREFAVPFEDEFNGTEASPLQKHWRVQTYDAEGILGGKRGFNFLTRSGQLVNHPLAEGRQGGLCTTGFYREPQQNFSVEFTVEKKGKELRLTPVWLSDTHGQIGALTLDGENWTWQAYATLLDFRAGVCRPDSLSGKVALEEGTTYQIRLIRQNQQATWELTTAGKNAKLAAGTAPLPNPGAMRYGFGLVGDETAVVAFDNVSVR